MLDIKTIFKVVPLQKWQSGTSSSPNVFPGVSMHGMKKGQ